MYQAFFGLREKPFNLTPDPKFLYLNASYREALAGLHYGIAERKGFAALIGEAGTGKTTLLRRLLAELSRDTRSVLVINPAVGFEELLRFILTDLGRPPAPGTGKLQMLEALNAELLDTLARGGNVVVLIDEAQDLTIPVLEELRLLSNLETAKEKILQFVLAGQPELDVMLARPEIRQLRQRIAVNARLRPLGRPEVKAYVAARIAAAGGDERGLFRPGALYRLWRFSGGVPRLVNVACDNALVTAYAAGRRSVGWKAMGEAVRDLRPAGRGAGASWYRVRAGTVVIAAVLGAAVGLGVSRLAGSSLVGGAARPLGDADDPQIQMPLARAPAVPAEVAVPAPAAPPAVPSSVASPAPSGAPSHAQGPLSIEPPGAAAARTLPAAPDDAARDDAAAGAGPAADAASKAGVGVPQSDAQKATETSEADAATKVPPATTAEPPPRAGMDSDWVPARAPSDRSRSMLPERHARVARGEARASEVSMRAAPHVTLVRVERGDTLTKIARRHYGVVSGELLSMIKRSNPEIQDPDLILTGGTILLPAPGGATDVLPPIIAPE